MREISDSREREKEIPEVMEEKQVGKYVFMEGMKR